MKGFTTASLHGFHEKRLNPPHVLPIYPSSSFTFETLEESIEVFTKQKSGHVYSRYGNPTIQTVEDQLATLETLGQNQEATCLLTSSGMSAIHVILSAILKSGDALLTQKKLYGGTTELFSKVLVNQGIQINTLKDLSEDQLDLTLQQNPAIKVIYLETPSNPTLHCIDLASVAQWAQKNGVITVLDNTFCTAFHQRGLALGMDYVIYSTTKYLNGHGNSIAGAIISTHLDFMHKKVWTQLKLSGSTCNAFDAWLIHNGLKTLELRMIRHSENALLLSRYLSTHPMVSKVYYPGLESHETYTTAIKQMQNGFGGMLSFEIKGGLASVSKVVKQLKLATYAPTLGDVDTLIMHPASSSHLNISEADRLEEGVTEGLLRVSVGIENIEDLISDFEQAMN